MIAVDVHLSSRFGNVRSYRPRRTRVRRKANTVVTYGYNKVVFRYVRVNSHQIGSRVLARVAQALQRNQEDPLRDAAACAEVCSHCDDRVGPTGLELAGCAFVESSQGTDITAHLIVFTCHADLEIGKLT